MLALLWGDNCVLWHGYRNKAGYGQIGRRHATERLAHRWMFATVNGYWLLPDKSVVMHTCDTPACVNPKHLRLATQWDNIHDCISKGRKHVHHPVR